MGVAGSSRCYPKPLKVSVLAEVLAHLRAEAGDTGQRDQIAAQENPVADVFFPGAAGMAVARGRSFFEQRRAERAASAAETNGQGHDG